MFTTEKLIRHRNKCHGCQARVLFTYQHIPILLLSVQHVTFAWDSLRTPGSLALYSGDVTEVVTPCEWSRSNGASLSPTHVSPQRCMELRRPTLAYIPAPCWEPGPHTCCPVSPTSALYAYVTCTLYHLRIHSQETPTDCPLIVASRALMLME